MVPIIYFQKTNIWAIDRPNAALFKNIIHCMISLIFKNNPSPGWSTVGTPPIIGQRASLDWL